MYVCICTVYVYTHVCTCVHVRVLVYTCACVCGGGEGAVPEAQGAGGIGPQIPTLPLGVLAIITCLPLF